MRLAQPWPDGFSINPNGKYGMRRHPITGKVTFHHGVDVAMPVGTPLTAPADGVVVHKNKTASAGFNLILRHEGTWHTVYYHLQKPSPLSIGAQVQTGDLIAYSGNTGASTGPHLHWELRKSRTWGDTVDPMPYVVKAAPVEQPVQAPAKPVRPIVKPRHHIPNPIPGLSQRFFKRRGR